MKKLISLFCLITAMSFGQIATKYIGTDTASGLSERIKIWQFTVDDSAQKVVVVYTPQLFNGSKWVKDLPTQTYTRYNKAAVYNAKDSLITPADNRYTNLENSSLGVGLRALFNNDLVPINSPSDLSKLIE